jgi:hypothetical protein
MSQSKPCTKCGEVKLFSEFNKDNSRKDKHQAHCRSCRKSFRDDNADTINAKNREYYQENRERIIEYQIEYERINKEKKTEYRKQWYQDNRPRIRENQKDYYELNNDKLLEKHREHYRLNPEMYRANSAKYRSLKQSTSTTDPWELQQIAIFYSDCPEGWHVDHILPLALGGYHELANLQHLTPRDNLSKHAKHPDDWNDPRPISCRA